jgi:signal transduction histidine kinase
VVRHAAARTLWVELRAEGGRVELRVRDDGRGFQLLALPADRYGLRGLVERSAALGGELRVQSAPGQGATVQLLLPY